MASLAVDTNTEEEERQKREEALSKKIEELQQIEHLKHVSTECLKGIYETLKRLNLPVDDLLGITGKQTLYLRSNQIAAGAQAIGEALKVNQTLQTLNLESNQIGDAGAQAIADALKVNQTLQELDLEHNNIGVAGEAVIKAAWAGRSDELYC